ncbi:MAG: hypothetical protein EP318_15545 [Rhodobacteraceae bacterium]|nr:MAG: hypothetical protein EP318_15545 [Paracoccaceae bacterium]
MTNFSMARGLAGLFSVLGWIVVVGAVVMLAATRAESFEAIVTGVILAGSGCLLVATGQILLAQIVTAESTERLLAVMQARPVSEPSPAKVTTVQLSPADVPPSSDLPEESWSYFDTYKGYKVEQVDGKSLYRTDGRTFTSLDGMQRYVNGRT